MFLCGNCTAILIVYWYDVGTIPKTRNPILPFNIQKNYQQTRWELWKIQTKNQLSSSNVRVFDWNKYNIIVQQVKLPIHMYSYWNWL